MEKRSPDTGRGEHQGGGGPLMPGRYKVEGSKKYPYALVKDTREVALFDDTDGEVELEVDLTGWKTHVELYSAFGDTRAE